MTKTTFKVDRRSEQTPAKIRRSGRGPANVYIAHKPSIALELTSQSFKKLYEEVGETGLIYLDIEGESKAVPALIDQVDWNYLGNQYQHVVFRAVNLKEKIKANVPVELIGECEIPESVVITVQNEVEVEALPTDLPEKFELDISQFKAIGDSFTLADLDFNQEEVSLVLNEDEQPEAVTLVAVQEQKEEEPEEVVETELEEPALVGEEEVAEGEGAADAKDQAASINDDQRANEAKDSK